MPALSGEGCYDASVWLCMCGYACACVLTEPTRGLRGSSTCKVGYKCELATWLLIKDVL